MDGGDVRIVDGREHPCFAPKVGQAVRVRSHTLRQELQRNFAAELRILGPPHHAHPALADLGDEAVMLQYLTRFRH